MNRSMVFYKCFCCNKNFNAEKLIELNKDSVVIDDEIIFIPNLLLDCCLISIDTTKSHHICEDCKNQLVYFHMFKRDIKKYSSFTEHIISLKILVEVERQLTQFDSLERLKVIQHENSLIISSEEPKLDEILPDQEEESIVLPLDHEEMILVEKPEEVFTPKPPQEQEIVEEYIYEGEEIVEEEFIVTKTEEVIEDDEEEPPKKRKRSRKYKYPINTNDSLTEKQRDWINQQVRNCEVVTDDGRTVYKCPLCDTVLKISGSLKKHLRDCHLLKSEAEISAKNKRQAFKDEIEQCKLIIETAEGQEIVWRCQRCTTNRIFHSEAGLKFHIRFNHIRCGQIDTKYIAQCKVVVEDENGSKEVWECPIDNCMKALRSRDGLRNHMKLEHSEAVKCQIVDEPPDLSQSQNFQDEEVLTILERKRRSFRPDAKICLECGVQFINGTSKKEKSCRIHAECHKILNVVSNYYQLPKCETSKVLFSNTEDLNAYLSSDQLYFEPIPCEGMSARVTQKIKDPVGSAVDDDAWKCGHCATKFTTEVECIAHVMILHSKKLICPVDHMEFEGTRGISNFNVHMRNKHSDMFPDLKITCTYCQALFESHFEKLAHMKICAEKKFCCDHCGRFFYKKTDLTRHLKIVSGELRYVCDVCFKSCASTMDLRLHKTSHNNQKLYVCSYSECRKAFKTPAARSSHMEKHNNVNFPCLSCSASFTQRALLKRHMKKCSQKKRSEGFEIIYENDQLFEVTEVAN